MDEHFPASANDVTAGGHAIAAGLDRVIGGAVDEGIIVGTVVVIVQNGKVLYRRAAGYADREARLPMREDAIFRLASVTKPIVSVAALTLVEDGMLGLEEDIARYLPRFRPRLANGGRAGITVRHLLTHTAGLSYGFFQTDDGPYARAGVSDGLDQPGLSIEENLQRIASVPLAHHPGEAWAYSVATDVVGAVIAKIAGMSLPALVQQRITGPLGMTDTGFAEKDRKRLSAAYADAGAYPARMDGPSVVPFGPGAIRFASDRIFDRNSYPSGGAGMAGTADDFATFLEALRLGGHPVLRAETVRMLTTNAVGDLEVTALGAGWGFGLGFGVLKDPVAAMTPQSAGTWHWGGAYGHSWFVDPVHELVVVAMTNTAIAGMVGPYPTAIRDAVYAAVLQSRSDQAAAPVELAMSLI
jgi:CubicO group peptidase (beta-lactamase class C family)